MKVTAEDLVRAIQEHRAIDLAYQMGLRDWHPARGPYAFLDAVQYIARHIPLPPDNPTIPGAINGQPATFEVVYRAEDCTP